MSACLLRTNSCKRAVALWQGLAAYIYIFFFSGRGRISPHRFLGFLGPRGLPGGHSSRRVTSSGCLLSSEGNAAGATVLPSQVLKFTHLPSRNVCSKAWQEWLGHAPFVKASLHACISPFWEGYPSIGPWGLWVRRAYPGGTCREGSRQPLAWPGSGCGVQRC